MICPQCRLSTPENSYRCIHCNAISKPPVIGAAAGPNPGGRLENSFFRAWMALPLAMLAVLGYLFFTHQNRTRAVNAFNPGAEFDVEVRVQKGKMTIVDFYSDYCPPCRQISPLLKKLDKQRPDLVVLAVDINRKGVKGIDWRSPLALQYKLASIPHFQIYDLNGSLIREGGEAYGEIIMMLSQAGIR